MHHPSLLPAAVQTAFHLAGVAPVLVRGLNRAAVLSSQAKIIIGPGVEREILLIDDALTPDQLEALAEWVLAEGALRLQPQTPH